MILEKYAKKLLEVFKKIFENMLGNF